MELLNKKKFEEITKNYYQQKARFEGIKPGDLVWECGFFEPAEIEYYAAVVENVNVDERYVDVIDVSSSEHQKKRYYGFLTESEFLNEEGVVKENIKEDYKKYKNIIDSVLERKVK